MLKKIVCTAAVLSVAALGYVTDASADASALPYVSRVAAAPNPALVARLLQTTIKGDLALPAAFERGGYGNITSLNGFQCANLVVVATSKETKPRPANLPPPGFWVPEAVWTRSVAATGTYTPSGHCSYSMVVPAGKEFHLTVGDHNTHFDCDPIIIESSGAAAWESVAQGATKVDNMSVTHVICDIIG